MVTSPIIAHAVLYTYVSDSKQSGTTVAVVEMTAPLVRRLFAQVDAAWERLGSMKLGRIPVVTVPDDSARYFAVNKSEAMGPVADVLSFRSSGLVHSALTIPYLVPIEPSGEGVLVVDGDTMCWQQNRTRGDRNHPMRPLRLSQQVEFSTARLRRPMIYEALVLATPAEELPGLISEIIRRDPITALKVIEQGVRIPGPEGTFVRRVPPPAPAALKPLLASSDRWVRERAIMLLGRGRHEDAPRPRGRAR